MTKAKEPLKNIHFVGIGGIGMSAIAGIFQKQGNQISGSDLIPSTITRKLQKSGAKISYKHTQSNIKKNHDLVIYSPAIPLDNPELIQAKKFKIEYLSYPQALGQLTKSYFTIAIAGSHGKSTTTAMTALLLTHAKLDPTVVIGTKIREFNNQNFRVGKSKYLVIEACEYKKSFINFKPDILVITNTDPDHLDFYKTAENYRKAFIELAKKVPKTGFIITESTTEKILKKISAKIIIPKIDPAIHPKILGEFNIHNATYAAEIGKILNIPSKLIIKSLNSYSGSWRRMEYKKTKLSGTVFIDDYGHHPTEIMATLKAIRTKYPKKKILCVFQPHQYSRTYIFLKEFGAAFKSADAIIIPNIYKVRDTGKYIEKVSTDILVNEIKKHHKNVMNGNGLENTANYLKKHHSEFDVIVTMGAGDIDGIYKYL